MFDSKVETGLRLATPHDRLGREVDDGVDLVLAQRPLQQRLVADVAADQVHPADQVRLDQLALREPSRARRQTTFASSSSRRRTTQPPTRPVAPVTRVGRSCQK